jgi:hypothetical protein
MRGTDGLWEPKQGGRLASDCASQAHDPTALITSDAVLTIQNKCLYTPLAEADPEVHDLVEKETWRQFSGLELIASEVSYPFEHFSKKAQLTGRT